MEKILNFCKISGDSVKKYEGKRKYIATGNILENKIVSFEEVYYDDKPSRANQNVQIGDVLFAKMQNTRKVIIINEENVNNIYSTGFYVIKPKKNVTSKFLFWLFNSKKFNNDKDKNCKGATQKALNNEGLRKIEIKILPSLKEQLNIVNKLDMVQAIIDIRKKQIEQLDELIKSQFVEMFGDLETNPYGWEKTSIGKECYYIKDGPHKSLLDIGQENGGHPFISVRNIVNHFIDFSTAKYISDKDYIEARKKCCPEKGDILYSKGGTTGIAKLIDVDIEFANWVHLAVLKFDRNKLNGFFFENLLNSDYCYNQSQRLTKGIANRDLVLGSMAQIKFYLPPIELQNKFAEFVEQIDKQKFEIQKSLEEIQKLQESLMNRYFGLEN